MDPTFHIENIAYKSVGKLNIGLLSQCSAYVAILAYTCCYTEVGRQYWHNMLHWRAYTDTVVYSFHDNRVLLLWKPQEEEGVLDAIIFLGMMFGGYLWGSLSDVVGRRSCLITSLTVNGLFGFASALSPNYPLFLFFRFGSGVG